MTYSPSQDNKLSDRIYSTPIDGLYYLEHAVHQDERGFYTEMSLIPDLNQVLEFEFKIKQINLSHSKQNVCRGIHAENWHKLASIIVGTAHCAFVDIRPESQTFGQVVEMQLSENGGGLDGSVFISAGIGNSFCALTERVDYLYHVDQLYRQRDKSGDQAISLFDPDLKINSPIAREEMLISQRDQESVNLRSLFPDKFSA